MKKLKIFPFQRKIVLIALYLCVPTFLSAQTTSYGYGAGTGGTDNSFFGKYAGRVTTGGGNLYMGAFAGYYNTSGSWSTFVGRSAGFNNTTGKYNTFIGSVAGFKNTTGLYNVYLGYAAGHQSSTSYRNAYIGYKAGYYSQSSDNTFIGYNAGKNNTSGTNTFIGSSAGEKHSSGSKNTYLGRLAGSNRTTGNENVIIGDLAGYSNSSISGSRNVVLGTSAGKNAASNNVFIGYNAGSNETGSNKLYIDNSSTSTPLIYGNFSTNQLGINALPATGYTLSVGGKMISEGLVVMYKGTWPDYVFEEEYDLPALDKVESFLKENKHLPEIPSAAEVNENGINVEEISTKLLQKIEELTLYTIAQEKLLKKQNDDIRKLVTRIEKLEEERNIEVSESKLK